MVSLAVPKVITASVLQYATFVEGIIDSGDPEIKLQVSRLILCKEVSGLYFLKDIIV